MEPLGRHAHFCAPGKKRREHGGHDLGGHHEHEPVGHHHQLAPDYDVGLALGVVRADELIAQPDLAAEIGGPGLLGEKRIGSGFDQAAVDAVGDQDTAQARAGLEQNVFDGRARPAFFFDRVRGREAGDSAADDGNAFHGNARVARTLLSAPRTRESRARTRTRVSALHEQRQVTGDCELLPQGLPSTSSSRSTTRLATGACLLFPRTV